MSVLKDGVAVYANVLRAPVLTGGQGPRLVRIEDTPGGVSPLLATYYQAKVPTRMEEGQPRKKRIDILREKLAAGNGTLADVQSIASSVNLMKARYMARPAAELLVERGDPMASEIAKGLAMTPVLGREPAGDLLRAAFKQALAKEGIPANIDEMARRFYAGRGHASRSQPAQAAKVDAFGWDVPGVSSSGGGILGVIRRLFGGGGS